MVVWAQPEVSRLWFFQELLASGQLDHVLGRPPLAGEVGEGPKTYPESHSIRKGLEFVREHYPEHFVIFQTADIWVQEGTYRFLSEGMQEHQAVVFRWINSCGGDNVWHTNFFAVADEAYWPPVSGPDHPAVLEQQWGMALAKENLPGIHASHNSRDQKFLHRHESEEHEPFPAKPQVGHSALSLGVGGWLPWYVRLYRWGIHLVCKALFLD